MEITDLMELAQLPATIIGFVMLYQMVQKMFAIIDRMMTMQEKTNERIAHIEKAQGIWPKEETEKS